MRFGTRKIRLGACAALILALLSCAREAYRLVGSVELRPVCMTLEQQCVDLLPHVQEGAENVRVLEEPILRIGRESIERIEVEQIQSQDGQHWVVVATLSESATATANQTASIADQLLVVVDGIPSSVVPRQFIGRRLVVGSGRQWTSVSKLLEGRARPPDVPPIAQAPTDLDERFDELMRRGAELNRPYQQ